MRNPPCAWPNPRVVRRACARGLVAPPRLRALGPKKATRQRPTNHSTEPTLSAVVSSRRYVATRAVRPDCPSFGVSFADKEFLTGRCKGNSIGFRLRGTRVKEDLSLAFHAEKDRRSHLVSYG